MAISRLLSTETRIPEELQPLFSMRTFSRLKCPPFYLALSSGNAGDKIYELQKDIALDEDLMSGESNKRLDEVSKETRVILLKVLHNYAEQWKQVAKITSPVGNSLLPEVTLLTPLHSHAVHVTRSYIALLIANITTYRICLEKSDVEDAFILALGQVTKLPNTASRKSHDQSQWRSEIEGLYEIRKNAPAKKEKLDLAWCPVLKDFIPKEKGTAAHVVPHALGYDLVKKIFSFHEMGKDVIFDPRNGLWMAKNVEIAFDRAQVVLIPVDTKETDTVIEQYDLKLVVLDEKLLHPGGNMILRFTEDGKEKVYCWNNINGNILDFREAMARPARRYLFFNYIYTVMRLAGQDSAQHAKRLDILGEMTGSWATPGSYLREGLLDMLKTKMELQLLARRESRLSLSSELPIQYPESEGDNECVSIANAMVRHKDELLKVQREPKSDFEDELSDE